MAGVAQQRTGGGIASACAALSVARASFYRRQHPKGAGPRRLRFVPRALLPDERTRVFSLLNADRFADRAPAQVYATLLDEGTFVCSIPTMYRILREHRLVRDRRNQRRHPTYHKPERLATGPNEVWSWDITKLLGPVKWTYVHLYVILDIFSRYVVGWMVAPRESAALAQRLIAETCATQGIVSGQLFLHADRGTSMTSQPVALLLADLGVTRSHSRPQVSNDNPFSEAQVKTLKYRPDFPARFGSLEDARVFCQAFFSWYNGEHRHSGIGLMTPPAVHDGRASMVRDARQRVLSAAYAAHPERFVRKPPQPPRLPHAVWINPPKEQSASQDRTGATISTADDRRVALKVEGLWISSEPVVVSPHAITSPTDEVVH
jgi:putative transposase